MSFNKDDERIGQTIEGRYVILEKIAHGGMATVYRALDRRLDREIAIKIMHPHLANGPEGATFVSRFRREARAAARLHHPGIVTVFDQGVDNNTSYLTMEYVPGTNLRRRIKDVGTFSVGDALKNIEHILRALAAAHRAGLVHRDIKPENILINKQGQLQITDFGLARVATELSASTAGNTFGTVAYLAPEIIETSQSDTRADVYSVGIMLYELIAGEQPYKGTSPVNIAMQHVNDDIPVLSDLHPEIPRTVSLLISVFCNRDRTKRPPDATKALELLTKLARSLTAAELAVKLPAPPPQAQEALNDAHVNNVDMNDLSAAEVSVALQAAHDAVDNVAYTPYSQMHQEPIVAHMADDSPNAPYDVQDYTTDAGASGSGFSTQDYIPTNILTAADLETVKSGSNGLNSDYHTTPDFHQPNADFEAENIKQKKRKLQLILACVIAFLTVLLIGAVFWWYQVQGPGSRVLVPGEIVGSKAAVAEKVLDDHGIRYKEAQEFSDTVPKGVVISVSQNSGESVSKRTGEVVLKISKGVQFIDVPIGIVGIPESEAVELIKKAGFKDPKITRDYSLDVEKDVVISSNPEEGSNQKHDVEIELVVSDGPRPVDVPDFKNMDTDDALAQIDDLGLKSSTKEQFSDSVDAGLIISQSLAPGSKAHEGDNIELTVSKGSETVEVPSVVGKKLDEARKILENAGFEVKTTGLQILGFVQQQSEKAGTKAKRGTQITLTVV